MLANATITVFENGGTVSNLKITGRHTISNVYWNDSRGRTVTKNGIQVADSVMIYLYSDEYVPKAGDIIAYGLTDFEFDCSTPKKASESEKLFRTVFPDAVTVKSVNNCMFGGLPHIEIIAR